MAISDIKLGLGRQSAKTAHDLMQHQLFECYTSPLRKQEVHYATKASLDTKIAAAWILCDDSGVFFSLKDKT